MFKSLKGYAKESYQYILKASIDIKKTNLLLSIIVLICYYVNETAYLEDGMEQHKREFRISWPHDFLPLSMVQVVPLKSAVVMPRFKIANFSRRGMFLETEENVSISPGTEINFKIIRSDIENLPPQKIEISGMATVKWVRPVSLGANYPRGIGVNLSSFEANSSDDYNNIFNHQIKKMKVKDLLISGVPSVFINSSLLTAFAIFQGFRAQLIVVLDGECNPVGILPLHSLLEKCNAEDLKWKSVQSLVQNLNCFLSSDDHLKNAIKVLKMGNRYDIPIIDNGAYVGILPYDEVMKYWTTYNELVYEAVINEQDRILGEVAHEIRSPLTYISGMFQLLKSGQMTVEEFLSTEIAEGIEKNLDFINSQVNDLLDKRRIKRGQVNLKLEKFYAMKFLQEEIDYQRKVQSQNNVNIEFIAEKQDALIESDKRRLHQILTNLVSNAVKFNRKGENVLVQASVAKGFLKIEVKDHGEGIPPEIMKEMFRDNATPYNQSIHDSHSTGIGLNIVKKIVDAMRGDLSVETEQGQGSTFKVNIPV